MGQFNSTTNNSSATENFRLDYRIALATMYSIILIGGIVSMALMIDVLKSNVRSVTTMAVLNLVAVHLLFLVTVPFRIYFYSTGKWNLTVEFCKVVSGMIHAHMYITFIFYVIILAIRYHSFFRKRDRVEFHRRLHALLVSAAVWGVVILCVLPALVVKYGSSSAGDDGRCFNFGGELENGTVAGLNYTLIAAVITTTLGLACCQAWIMWVVLRKFGSTCLQRQEFWAQIKSLSFLLVMIVCFVPYHLFRLYYVDHYGSLQNQNELFLAVTALSCFDMLIFLGRNSFVTCNIVCCINRT